MENKSGFTPKGDLILLLPPPVEEKTAGGIVLPKSSQDREAAATRMGTVVAMGDFAVEMSEGRLEGVKVGDNVLFPRYRGDALPVNKVTYLIMRGREVLGPITETPDYMIGAPKSSLEAFGVNQPEFA